MAENMDLTGRQLFALFEEKFTTVDVSLSTIKRARLELGWVSKRAKYCQLIAEMNKEKRVMWCLERVTTNDLEMDDVIFTDESTVQIEGHRKVIFHKQGQPIKLVARPKHPQKVHVWAGISSKGATTIVMFAGIMNATRYTDILDTALIPYLEKHFPHSHRFQQDKDPKHTCRWAQDHFTRKGINWWKTPPSSPDLNPIENVWGSMKEFLHRETKPKNVEELKAGIKAFWKTLTPAVCQKYIHHLKKVIPKVIEEDGGPSGY